MRFISEIPLIYIVISFILAAAIAYFLYRGKEGQNFLKKTKWTLIGLRTLGLFTICILFLGIFLQTTTYKLEKPILINLIDNSQSMLNYSDSSHVKSRIQDYLDWQQKENDGRYIIKNYLIGDNVRNMKNLTFQDSKTDLSKPIQQLNEQFYNSNIGAITLISDGNYNEGASPVYETGNFKDLPFYTLGVGDTLTKRDVLVKNIQANDFVYLNNSFPIEVLIEAKKIGNKTTKVRLLQHHAELASQTLSLHSNQEYYRLHFDIQAKKPGIQHYVVQIDPLSEEYTAKNNVQSFYIDVINDTKKILITSNAPHPDLAAIKQVLEKDKVNHVEVKLLKDWDKNSTKYDLIIFHNPLSGTSTTIANQIVQSKTPMLVIIGNPSNFSQNAPFTGMNFQSSRQSDENTPILNPQFDLFELSGELKSQLNQFPPLVSSFGKMKVQPNAKTLFYQGLNGIAKSSPQIFFHQLNGTKIGVIFGEGIWKWKLFNYKNSGNADAFTELFDKITGYLTAKKNHSPFIVTVPKRTLSNEPLILKAEVFNASMQPITKENVSLKLTNEKKRTQTYDFSALSSYYSLDLGKLPAGDYTWEATTTIDGKIQKATGEIVVEANHVEQMTNTADFGVLSQISQMTDGKFFPLKEYKKVVNAIQNKDTIVPIETQENTVKNLIDFWGLLLLIAGIFGIEWFIKKFNGSY